MNLALLGLLPAALVGLAMTTLGLWWLRVVHATLPGVVPGKEFALPMMFAAGALGAAVAGRVADGRPRLFGSTANWLGAGALATLAVGWLHEALQPTGVALAAAGWARLLRAGLPVMPALFLMASALPWLSLARARRGVPVVRATGSVACALACGGALGSTLFVETLTSSLGPRTWAALCMAAAALACAVLARLPGSSSSGSSASAAAAGSPDRRALRVRGLQVVGLIAWLLVGGALLVAGQQGLQRLLVHQVGNSLATTMVALTALQIGIAVGSAGLAWVPRSLPAGLLACLALLITALILTVPDLGWRHAETTVGVIAMIGPLGVGCGSLIAVASRARVRRPDRLGSWIGDVFAVWLVGGLVGGLLGGLIDRGSWSLRIGTDEALPLLALMSLVAAAVAALLGVVGARARAARVACAIAALVALGSWVPAMRAHVPELPLRWADRVELDGSSRAALDRRLGRMACALAPAAERVAVIGVGDGEILAAAAATTRGRVDGIEPNGQIMDLGSPLPTAGVLPSAPSPMIVHADPRVWLLEHSDTYDLVIVSPAVPWASGAADLLTRDAFLITRRALRPDGVLVQWVDLSQTPWPAFGAIAGAFLEAFPTTRLFVATPLSDRVVVGLVGALGRDLPALAEMQGLLIRQPTATGPNSADEVIDGYLTDQWGLATHLAAFPENTAAHPWSELWALGRRGEAERLAAINLRLLADLAQPLETSTFPSRPTEDKERVKLGRTLASQSAATAQLLVARADALELSLADGDPADPTRRRRPSEIEALERSLARSLLTAWQASPGHPTVRAAIIERGMTLQAVDGVESLGSLLESALAIHADGRLAGAYGGALLAIGHDQDALSMLREARKLAPDDRTTLLHLGGALVRTGHDQEAAEVWRGVRAQFGEDGLPPLQRVMLALLEDQPGSRQTARRLVAQLPAGEPWRAVLQRLLSPG